MKRIEPIGLGQALKEWALYECNSRLRDHLGGQPPSPVDALAILLQTRSPLIAQLFAAEPIETWRIKLGPTDFANLYTLEHPLNSHSHAMVVAAGAGGDHVRALVAAGRLDGPILATAKEGDDQVFFVDGLHRMWAWAELVRQGRATTIQASLVVTEQRSWWAEEHMRQHAGGAQA